MPPRANAGGRRRPGPSPFGEPRTLVFDADDLPDLTPIAGVGLVIVSGLIALTIGGSLAAAWETILLWAHQVPFSPDGATAVTDPVFGRDIGFFLFQLPFLRLVQGLFNALVIGSIIVVLARYLVGAARGGLVFTTPVRIHLAVLGGLFLLSVAFGYQLDKYELVYSTRGVATGVSFTDQHAQFFAFDILTDHLRARGGPPGGCGVHALHLAAGPDPGGLVRRLAHRRPDLPVRRPAADGRAEQVRPGAAVHRQQHRDDPSGVRPAGLGEPAVQGRPAADPGARRFGAGHVPERPAVGLPPAPGHARPAADDPPLLRLHRRRHRPLRHRRPAAPGDAVRPRAGARAEPERHGLGEPAHRLHPRHRPRDGPGQRGHQRGPARPVRRQPAAGVRPGGAADHPAADLLRGASVGLRRGRRPAGRVRLPDRRGRRVRGERDRHALDRHDRDQARQHADAAALLAALPRPRPDDQRPGDRRQPAAVPSLALGSPQPRRAVPQVRQGPVHRRRRQRPARLRAGRVHDVGPVPERPGLRPGRAAGIRASGPTTSTTSATA